MRELTLNEVHEVSGGANADPQLLAESILTVVAFAVAGGGIGSALVFAAYIVSNMDMLMDN